MIANASIIIPSHNRIEMLKDLLESLSYSTVFPLEVIVVDDASNREIAFDVNQSAYPFQVKIIRNSIVEGPASARNIGVYHSKGSILVFTDDDCVVDKTWLEVLVSNIESSEKMLGGISGTVHAYYTKDIFNKYCDFHHILEPRQSGDHEKDVKRVPHLVTANCAIKRDVFMKVGGFDEAIKIAGGEDCVLSVQIAKMGYFFKKEEKAIVWHKFKKGFRKFYRTFYSYGLGTRYLVDHYLSFDNHSKNLFRIDAERGLKSVMNFRKFPYFWLKYKEYRQANISFFDSFFFVVLKIIERIAYKKGLKKKLHC